MHTIRENQSLYNICQSGVRWELDGVIAHLMGWELDANTSRCFQKQDYWPLTPKRSDNSCET